MKLGRIRRTFSRRRPDQAIVAARPDEGRWSIDLARAYALGRQAEVATPDAARRLGRGPLPVEHGRRHRRSGRPFLDAAHGAVDRADDASLLDRGPVLGSRRRPAGDPRRTDLPGTHAGSSTRGWRRSAQRRSSSRRRASSRGRPATSTATTRSPISLLRRIQSTTSSRSGLVVGRRAATSRPTRRAPPVRRHDLQRLQRPRHPGPRDGDGDGPAEGQGLRVRHRSVDHDDRRCRPPELVFSCVGERRTVGSGARRDHSGAGRAPRLRLDRRRAAARRHHRYGHRGNGSALEIGRFLRAGRHGRTARRRDRDLRNTLSARA